MNAGEATARAPSTEKVPWYLIVSNVAKRNNLGQLVRSASAFDVCEILCVGRKKDVNFFGAHGSNAHVKFRFFATLADCVAFLKERGVTICGIEIDERARAVQTHPFHGPTAFLPGNEGDGLHAREMAICDEFVYIPHYGAGTASLNVTVASSIIFHHFATWAGYAERERAGHKFVVAERQVKAGAETTEDLELQRERAQAREAFEAELDNAFDEAGMGAIFDA